MIFVVNIYGICPCALTGIIMTIIIGQGNSFDKCSDNISDKLSTLFRFLICFKSISFILFKYLSECMTASLDDNINVKIPNISDRTLRTSTFVEVIYSSLIFNVKGFDFILESFLIVFKYNFNKRLLI